MTAKITADATGTKVLIGVAAEDSLQIDGTAKTVKALAPYAVGAQKVQLGSSATPANNFTLDASADNGTMKLARGNAGATTQDVMTVDAAGKLLLPIMPYALGAPIVSYGSNANGVYVLFADGTQICYARKSYGATAVSALGAVFAKTGLTWTFPRAFSGDPPSVIATRSDATNQFTWVSCASPGLTDVSFAILCPSSGSPSLAASLIAIGRQ